VAGDVGEEGFGQALAGLAVGAGLGGARGLPPRQAVGDQAGDGGAARVVGAEDLPQEDPQRDHRREDPVQPAGEGGQRPGHDLFGEDVGERQLAVLKELPPQEVYLPAKRSPVGTAHRGPPWRSMGWLPISIFPSEGPFAHVAFNLQLAEIYVPFACRTEYCSVLGQPS